jgi:hypothetical protein
MVGEGEAAGVEGMAGVWVHPGGREGSLGRLEQAVNETRTRLMSSMRVDFILFL